MKSIFFLFGAILAFGVSCKPNNFSSDSPHSELQSVDAADATNGTDGTQGSNEAQGTGGALTPWHKILDRDYLIFCSYFVTQRDGLNQRKAYFAYLQKHQNDYCGTLDGFAELKYQARGPSDGLDKGPNTCCLSECPKGFDRIAWSGNCYKGYVDLNENRYRIAQGVQTIQGCIDSNIWVSNQLSDGPGIEAAFAQKAASGVFEKRPIACRDLGKEWLRNPFMSPSP